MKRTELEIKYLKNKTGINLNAYEKQRNSCTNLKLSMNSTTDNKEFWKNIIPLLIDKVTASTKISLVKKGKLIPNETKVAETFSNAFEMLLRKMILNEMMCQYYQRIRLA